MYIMCANFIAEMIIKSKIMKSYHDKVKSWEKMLRYDKKAFTYLHYLHINCQYWVRVNRTNAFPSVSRMLFLGV